MNRFMLIMSVAVLSVTSGCHHKATKTQMPPLKVEVCTVQIDSLYDRVNIASQIQGINSAVIQPRVDGFLIATHYQGGMPVRRGDLLFTIDPSTFATSLYSAQAAVESAKASEALAQRNYERAAPLAEIDAISQSDLDQYRASYKAARASTKQAEEGLRNAELEIGYTKIYAPISGVAAKTTAARGDYIGPGTLQSELTSISQLDTICIELPIPTAKFLRYEDSTSSGSFNNSALLSDIELTLADSTIYNYMGEYYYTRKDTPSATSTVVVVARFPNPDLKLKAGMFARVTANIGASRGCITVPRTAVSQLQGINSVWVIESDSTAQWRKVALGESRNGMWEITQGLAQGEKVVVSGGLKLHNGVKVAATEAK